MNDLVDLYADLLNSTVVFAVTPVGAGVPKVARKLAAGAKPTPTTSSTTTTVPPNPPTISLDEFNQLQPGMSYEQAVQIIGGPGELTSQSTSATSMR